MCIAISSNRLWAGSFVAVLLLSFILAGCSADSRPTSVSVIDDSSASPDSLTPVNIALFGDSTFETRYLSAEQNPALVRYWGTSPGYDARLHVQLADELGRHGVEATVVNYGVSGLDSTEALAGRFGRNSPWADCVSDDPDIVIIRFGPNDMNAGTSADDFRDNLTRMVDEARGAGMIPVLVTNNHLDYPEHSEIDWSAEDNLGQYTDAIISISRKYELTLVDVRGRFVREISEGNWDLYGHNDKEYFRDWEDGSEPGTPAFYTNIHQWTAGTAAISEEIARALVSYEPAAGGDSTAPGRADAWMPDIEND